VKRGANSWSPSSQDGEKGLAAYFEKEKGAAVLGEGGIPPMPVAYRNPDATKYNLLEEQTYGNE